MKDMSEYRGRLTPEQRAILDPYLTDPEWSVRRTAVDTGIPYGQVRGYAEWKADQIELEVEPPDQSPKMLVFDIETTPLRTWNWGLWKQNALDIDQDWYLLCFAYSWWDLSTLSATETGWVGLPQEPGYDPTYRPDIDQWVARRMWHLLDEADIVIGQNSNAFDIKKVNARFALLGMDPPSPYQTIDTKVLAKGMFNFPSNSMKYLAKALGVTLKKNTTGFELWLGCMAGDPAAWAEMEDYNRNDVVATAEIYGKLLAWFGMPGKKAHPNIGLYIGSEGKVCTNCGNKEKEHGGEGFQLRKYYYTNASKYASFRCNRCGTYARSYQRVPQRTRNTRTYLR